MSPSDVSQDNTASFAEASVRRAVDALQQGTGQYDGSAVEAMKQARAFFNSQNLYAQAATCALNLGDHFWKKEDVERAKDYYEAARNEFALADIERQTADATMNLAMVLWKEGDLARARSLYLEALNYFTSESLDHDMASVKVSLAGVHESAGEHDLALAAYRDSLAYYEANDSAKRVDQCRAGIGRVLLYDDKFDEAEPYFVQASEGFREREETKQYGDCLVALADIYHAQGRNDDARRTFEEARRVFSIN